MRLSLIIAKLNKHPTIIKDQYFNKNGECCAVAALFTEREKTLIKLHDNDTPAWRLPEKVLDRLEKQYGLLPGVLEQVQSINDSTNEPNRKEAIINYLRGIMQDRIKNARAVQGYERALRKRIKERFKYVL